MGKQVKGHTQWTSRTTTGKGCAVELNVEIWLMWKIETTGDQNGRRRNISVWDQISKAMNQTHYLSAMKRKPSREEHKIALASASQDIHWCHLPGHTSEFPCFWKESWVIQEKHAIAKQSESTSLVTEKPVKKKKKTSTKICLDWHALSSLVSVSLHNPGEYHITDQWNSSFPGALRSVQSVSCVQLFATPRTAACQASLSITNSQSLLKLMCIESAMQSNHLICHSLLKASVFHSIRVFSNESLLCITWPKYSSFSIGLSN